MGTLTQPKLNIIQHNARRVKNQGELAVYKRIVEIENIFDPSEINLIKYCAEECKRQQSGELSVYWMLNAWTEAQKLFYSEFPYPQLNIDFIAMLGILVEPYKNINGLRSRPGDRIGISNGYEWIEKTPPENIRTNLERLILSYYDDNIYSEYHHPLSTSPEDEFYYQYEHIHPFMDGNGRTGKILYNYLNGTLDNPRMPPNFFGGSNP